MLLQRSSWQRGPGDDYAETPGFDRGHCATALPGFDRAPSIHGGERRSPSLRAWRTGRTSQADLISIRGPNGGHIGLAVRGFEGTGIELPQEIFRDYAAQSFIRQDGPEDDEGRIIFRLTTDGRRAGHTPSTALAEIAEYVHQHCHQYVIDVPRSLDQAEKEGKEHRIRTLGAELAGLSAQARSRAVTYGQFEKILEALHREGFFPLNELVSHVAHAIERQ